MSRPNMALFACLVVLLALATPSHSEERELELEAFEAIKSCLPLNVLVAPTDDGPKLKVDAEEGVVGAVQAEVLDGVLVLSLSETIGTEAPAKVTVSAPKEGLVMVVNTGSGKLVLGPGFRGETLELSNDGKGELVAVDVEVPGLTVSNNGNGALFASGAIGDVTATAQRGGVFLAGPTGAVTVSVPKLTGSPEIVVIAGSDDVEITGDSDSGTANVLYDIGSCDVEGGLLVRSLCKQVTTEELVQRKDELLASLLWTCNANVEADPGCTAEVDIGSADGSSAATGSAFGTGNSESTATVIVGDRDGPDAMGTAKGDVAKAEAEANDAGDDDEENAPECAVSDEDLKMLES